jgi:integrase
VSELKFITVETVKFGSAEVTNKGKTRVVFIPDDLQRELLEYIKRNNIKSGSVFVTKNGKPLNRSNIWADMKKLCAIAGVDKSKVFPHSLRALFSRTFHGIDKDLAILADALGHSDVNTTRIYVRESSEKCRWIIESLGLARLSYST